MKTLLLILLTASLLSTGLSAQTEMDTDLSDLKWKNRVLLIFSPNSTHTDLNSTLRMIKEHQEGFEERDLVSYEIIENSGNYDSDHLLSDENAKALRDRFNIDPSEFRIILIGKDGGSKYRSDEFIRHEKLFDVIDEMPMRRLEMKKNG